jgi:hypothetical protein
VRYPYSAGPENKWGVDELAVWWWRGAKIRQKFEEIRDIKDRASPNRACGAHSFHCFHASFCFGRGPSSLPRSLRKFPVPHRIARGPGSGATPLQRALLEPLRRDVDSRGRIRARAVNERRASTRRPPNAPQAHPV